VRRLQPLAHVPLDAAGSRRQLGRRRGPVRQRAKQRQAVAQVDVEHGHRGQHFAEDPLGEGVDFRLIHENLLPGSAG
jgi:hypothetical protein